MRKFRSVAEMGSPPSFPPRDPRNVKLACELSDIAARLRPRRFPPGVYKHRSLEEANHLRRVWERAPGQS